MLFPEHHIEIDNEGIECNHRATARDTTLVFLKRDFLVYPPNYYAICKCCGKSFTFTKNDDGQIILVNDMEGSENVNVKRDS